jgi:excisionase family DNA binding protein
MTAQPSNSKRLLRVKDAAFYLSISPAQVRAIVQRGELPIVKDGDGKVPWKVDIRDLDQWIDRHKRTL